MMIILLNYVTIKFLKFTLHTFTYWKVSREKVKNCGMACIVEWHDFLFCRKTYG